MLSDDEVFEHGEAAYETDLLEGAPEAALGTGFGLEIGDVLAEQSNVAPRRRVEARHAVEQRRLAGAVGSENADDLGRPDL